MIASERSLAPAHQSQQQRKPVTLGNPRNGATKPPVRPVKIYVIDPRKLQQRLEAYVDQKNQKRAEAEAEKERQDNEKQETEKCEQPLTPKRSPISPPGPVASKSTTTTNANIKHPPAKVLSVLAPKPPVSISTSIAPPSNGHTTNHQNAVLGNGTVTLQSLPCINGTTLNLPALPLVVTNGVALIQPPISQSSIPTSGLFLPGVTAISSVAAAPQQQLHAIKAKPRCSTTQKRKVKKKKAKKRKMAGEKEKDEEDDGELSYLLKETTTRLGRISRPVSQPHSPLVSASLSAASSRAPSPKLKRKVPRKEEVAFQCAICSQNFASGENLNSHFEEFPLHRGESKSSLLPQHSVQQKLTSTNVQDPTTLSPSFSFTRTGTTKTTTTATDATTLLTTHTQISGTGGNGLAKSFELSDTSTRNVASFEGFPVNTQGSFQISTSNVSRNDTGENVTFSSTHIGDTTKQHSLINRNMSFGDNESEVNASLVPTAGEKSGIFQRCMTSSSSVVHVPSSYSIPSSPPSRCQSPGSPEIVFADSSSKRGACSPVATCNSPIDPMLLHSRSPFPPPIPETSSHSVGASNLSIPEESLCKGELFMDLGGNGLENTNLSTISPTPFGNNDSNMGHLFADCDSERKEPTEELQESNAQRDENVASEVEERDSNSASGKSVVTPMMLENTEDANDGEIFQTANYTRTFLHPSVISSTNIHHVDTLSAACEDRNLNSRSYPNGITELPRTPQSACLESDASMDSSETMESTNITPNQKCRSIWQFVKDQIKCRGISQACGEISEMADKLARIARDHFIPIRDEEIERLGNSSSIIHVDTPFFSHLLDLPFGMYIFKEELGTRKKPAPPPMTSSELSFTGGVEDVEKFLPPDIDLISLPHLTNLDLT